MSALRPTCPGCGIRPPVPHEPNDAECQDWAREHAEYRREQNADW